MYQRTVLVLFTFLFSLMAHAAVDLNSASSSELESVNGIGPSKAAAIVDYRSKNGAFKSVDDLDKVPGFGSVTMEKVRKELTVGASKAVAAKPEKIVKEVKK
ncbi:helix-hairpin-helix domain-containing protein [Pseudomethylobacillus aquaticus]|uniref:Helix-hairpin-helix domain-containing protein n=1 Tax=Pseudomethylobacillus aquaticus TaxID=2676064 RepID=A0A3N0UXN8_9PROT|nr:helix-hairpin-helix domain-containing protein [Pseudomethylobacillus aquaticus]ROH85297.1 helix-hairpin-helix domain-containing protein [Pseudomethylobacillus aquaticus]